MVARQDRNFRAHTNPMNMFTLQMNNSSMLMDLHHISRRLLPFRTLTTRRQRFQSRVQPHATNTVSFKRFRRRLLTVTTIVNTMNVVRVVIRQPANTTHGTRNDRNGSNGRHGSRRNSPILDSMSAYCTGSSKVFFWRGDRGRASTGGGSLGGAGA